MTNYNAKHIRTLEGIEAIRLRPGMFISSVGIKGVKHLLLEVVSNSIDEYLSDECDTIKVIINDDDSILVSDNGRGIPFGKAEDGSETLENLFTKLHTGAKFASDGTTGYNSSGGMNGVGVKAANALSDYLIVTSVRDNKVATMKFERGVKKSFVVKNNTENLPRGTTIHFLPDKEIFKEDGITIPKQMIEKQLQELSFLSSGLKIEFKYKKDKVIQYFSNDGLIDYIHQLVPEKDMSTKVYKININEDKYKADIVFTYSNKVAENVKLFTNNIPNNGGTHLTGFKSALTRVLNDTARSMNILRDKEENLSGDDLREGLNLIISLKMNDPVFSGQTKEVLTSAEARTFIEQNVSAPLKQIFLTNYEDTKTIIGKAKLSRKARLAAKAAREAVKKKQEKTILKSSLQGKLADCLTKDTSKAELFLVEGERLIAHLF